MRRQQPRSSAMPRDRQARAPAIDIVAKAGDWHDVIRPSPLLRQFGDNGGERIVESRRRPPARLVNLCGFRESRQLSSPQQEKRGGMAPAAPQLLYSLVQG